MTCSACGHELYRPPNNWLLAFREVPDWLQGRMPPSASAIQVTAEANALCFRADASGDEPGAGRSLPERYVEAVVTQGAFEELSAVSEAVFPGHLSCLASHHHLSYVQCLVMSFECVPAAAVVRTSALFGLGMGEGEVGWSTGTRVPGRRLHGAMHADLEKLPDWCHRPYVQAVTRALLADAVKDFKAAKSKRRTSEWRPSSASWPSWSFQDEKLTLRGIARAAGLDSGASVRHAQLPSLVGWGRKSAVADAAPD